MKRILNQFQIPICFVLNNEVGLLAGSRKRVKHRHRNMFLSARSMPQWCKPGGEKKCAGIQQQTSARDFRDLYHSAHSSQRERVVRGLQKSSNMSLTGWMNSAAQAKWYADSRGGRERERSIFSENLDPVEAERKEWGNYFSCLLSWSLSFSSHLFSFALLAACGYSHGSTTSKLNEKFCRRRRASLSNGQRMYVEPREATGWRREWGKLCSM